MIILKDDDLINIVVLKEGWSKTSANGNLASGEGRRSLIRNMISIVIKNYNHHENDHHLDHHHDKMIIIWIIILSGEGP